MPHKSIRLIDNQADLRPKLHHNHKVERGLAKAVRRSLFVDSWRRAEEAATAIGAFLEPAAGYTYQCGAYAVLKRCYRHMSMQATNPSRKDMDKVRGYFQTLYQR